MMRNKIALVSLLFSLVLSPVLSAKDEELWTVNFKETDILELIRFVSVATGKTMISDPQVRGTVQVFSNEAVNQAELYSLFLSILEVHGFAAVESGNVVRIIPAQEGRTAPVPLLTNASGDIEGYVTDVIELEYASAAKLIPVLRPLVPQTGHLAAYSSGNVIIIYDTVANIAKIRQIIDRIDKTSQEVTEVVTLTYASAEATVDILAKLISSQTAATQGETTPPVLIADERTNSIIISGADVQLDRIKTMIRQLDTPVAQTGNIRVVYLKYADATEMATVLSRILGNIENSEQTAATTNKINASVEADEGTNSLVITGDEDVMQTLQSVIDRLDIRRAQVLVEAIIVEISDVEGKDLGLQWLFMDPDGGYASSSANDVLGRTSVGAAALIDDDDTNDTTLAAVLASTTGGVLGFANRDDDGRSFNIVLNALQANTNANILSTPSILTMDNQQASITIGQNVPFVTGSYTSTNNNSHSPFQTIERENVGITLTVTPHINEGNTLVLDILQEVSSLTGAASIFSAADIITNERSISTKVTISDGQLIVLGGLIQNDVQDNSSKVPLLGDIPWLGRLFRYSSVKQTKQHLMVFIRATIIRDDATLSRATAEKYKTLREQQLGRVEDGVDLINGNDLPLLPEWQNSIQQAIEEQQSEQDAP